MVYWNTCVCIICDDVMHTHELFCSLVHLFTALQEGSTALMLASEDGHTDVVRHLVCCGKSDVNARNMVM